jgi:hypothetical protein
VQGCVRNTIPPTFGNMKLSKLITESSAVLLVAVANIFPRVTYVCIFLSSFCFFLLFNQWGKEMRVWAPVEIAVFLCFWAPAVNE